MLLVCLGYGLAGISARAADDAPGAAPGGSNGGAAATAPAPISTTAGDALPAANISPLQTPEGYPLHIEGMWVVCGARQFFLAFGRWPASWREVRDCGLFQARLIAADGHEVDPDAATPPLPGEVRYIPPATADATPQVATLADEKQGVQQQALEAPLSYKDLFNALYLLQQDEAQAKAMHAYFDGVLADDKRVLQFAMAGMLDQGFGLYRIAHGDYPPDWAALTHSGLSPVGPGAVNPATGQPLYGDGRAWDYTYKYYAPGEQRETSAYFFCHVDADGTAPQFPVMY
jgi:hypothetical protein